MARVIGFLAELAVLSVPCGTRASWVDALPAATLARVAGSRCGAAAAAARAFEVEAVFLPAAWAPAWLVAVAPLPALPAAGLPLPTSFASASVSRLTVPLAPAALAEPAVLRAAALAGAPLRAAAPLPAPREAGALLVAAFFAGALAAAGFLAGAFFAGTFFAGAFFAGALLAGRTDLDAGARADLPVAFAPAAGRAGAFAFAEADFVDLLLAGVRAALERAGARLLPAEDVFFVFEVMVCRWLRRCRRYASRLP